MLKNPFTSLIYLAYYPSLVLLFLKAWLLNLACVSILWAGMLVNHLNVYRGIS